MATIVTMPKLGTTMTEGSITKWLKKEGDPIQEGEVYAEIQTDKVNIEDEAPASGILRKILVKEGETVHIGEPIAIIADENEDISQYLSGKKEKIEVKETEQKTQEEKPSAEETGPLRKIKASPAARRIAKENNIDLSKLIGTGPGGRIVEKDVTSYIERTKSESVPPEREVEQAKQIDKQLKPAEFTIKRTIPVTGMRKIIAEKMAASKKLAPHIYLSLDADMTKVIELREKLLPSVIEKHNVKLSYNDILIKAVAVALKQNPIINSSFTEEEIILKEEINIGLAVALDDGLIVPVIKNADRKGLIEIAKETSELIAKARDRKLLPDDYYGGTFTISNLGMYDIENFSAIINQPETAILAVGKMMKKPVAAENDEIVVKPMMNLTLSCDHRAIDGAAGAKFLQNLKQILEEPINMIL